MFSLWKDLLFLHGHMLRKENLDWRPDAPSAQQPDKHGRKARRAAAACCATVWPRIMGPR
ncbi:MAG: hypothetical protein EPN68_16290 [Rhodanobacter sp.]|jgi:hypothetical protein|uniref:Uncharacterized protein n=1 Tax=Rhodanobacter glycinis TaxID=582702 RepID=A0A5B9E6L4_9GAMM|nr:MULTISPECIES: hypothetical protein [Rhodanobacter]QEE26091.1 hypothetical protein CS053_17450 [Rhodanobacter glycinis]TAM16729.1 MAG: hypothetical protein EPN68_16290 [Rhodanobacter sp.]